MSYTKRAYEAAHPEDFEGPAMSRDELIADAPRPLFGDETVTPECASPEEGRLFFAGDDPELNDALDEYLTRTQEA